MLKHETEQCCGVGLTHKYVDAWVFTRSRIDRNFRIRVSQCDVCNKSYSPDGSEDFILRKSFVRSRYLGEFELCFTWQVLYGAKRHITKGGFFHTHFTDLLQEYQGGLDGEYWVLEAMQSLYPHFRDAVMDFVDLMELPYRAELSCKCDSKNQFLIFDGLTVACKRSAMHLTGTWLTPPT